MSEDKGWRKKAPSVMDRDSKVLQGLSHFWHVLDGLGAVAAVCWNEADADLILAALTKQEDADSLKRALDASNDVLKSDWDDALKEQVEQLQAEGHELRNLLAIIHRDGGHYFEEHGAAKAVADAHLIWGQLQAERDEWKEIFGLREIAWSHEKTDLTIANAALRKQTRWAWGKLGCRCGFDPEDNKTFEDAHCPVHGVYGEPLWQLDTALKENAALREEVENLKATNATRLGREP